MQTVGRSPDISVMWRTEYYAGAGYIRHVAVNGLNNNSAILLNDSYVSFKCMAELLLKTGSLASKHIQESCGPSYKSEPTPGMNCY